MMVVETVRETREVVYGDLFEVLPRKFPMRGYCGSRDAKDGEHFWDWEESVEMYLAYYKGFKQFNWRDGERNDGGTLTRIMTCKDEFGRFLRFIYW